MKKTTMILVSVAILLLAACCSKTDVYNNPTTATLPVEKKYQGNGAYEVSTTEFASSNDTIGKLVIAYPAALISSPEKWPLVMTCNPSNTSGEDMLPIMRHLASWGFVVVGNMDKQTGTGRTMSITLDEFIALGETTGNLFYNKIDTSRIGLMGFSQGAFGSLMAITKYENSRRYKVLYLGSCPQPLLGHNMGWGDVDYSQLHIPMLHLIGEGFFDYNTICPPDTLTMIFDQLLPSDLPTATGRRIGKDHENIAGEGDPYMTAWFCHWMLGDTEAARAFCGPDAELLHNDRWRDVKIKNM
ncbi:MAG: hypothetical protein K6F85_01350 [Bacteroidales bacterium]|nr:hypothetical protein [Bacteroidales bacterium]